MAMIAPERKSATPRATIYTPAILLLVLIVALSNLGLGFVGPLRALYARSEGATSGDVGWMASSFLLAGFVTTPFVGWLADRVGYRNVLGVGLLLHALLVLAYIPVRAPVMLIALRACEGAAAAAVLPPARALLNGLAPRDRQGEALGLVSAGLAAGMLLGPAVGTLLASQVGYTPSFVIAAIVLALSTIAVPIFLPGHAERQSGLLLEPAARVSLFTPGLVLAYTLRLILSLPQGVGAAVWSLFMQDRGASLPLIGLSYTTYAVPLLVLTPFVGRFSDRRGRYVPAVGGFMLYGIVFCTYGLLSAPLIILAVAVIEGIASGAARGAVDGLLADHTPASARGRVQAVFSTAQTAGGFIGATLSGYLYGIRSGSPFVTVGALFGVTAVALLVPSVRQRFDRSSTSAEHCGVSREAADELHVAG